MKQLVNFARLALFASAAFCGTTAWADCNCNKVPPAPTFFPQAASAPAYVDPYQAGPYFAMPSTSNWQGYPSNAVPVAPLQTSPTPIVDPNLSAVAPPTMQNAPGTAGYNPAALPQGTNYDPAGPHWAPGGYEPRTGSPTYYHDPAGGDYVVSGNPYNDHFGPGFHRNSIYGHYSFPYYSYRRPWYFPGRAVYNRNTNYPW